MLPPPISVRDLPAPPAPSRVDRETIAWIAAIITVTAVLFTASLVLVGAFCIGVEG